MVLVIQPALCLDVESEQRILAKLLSGIINLFQRIHPFLVDNQNWTCHKCLEVPDKIWGFVKSNFQNPNKLNF